MATNKKFNVRHGLSAGTGSTQKDIVSDTGLIYDVGLLSNLSTTDKSNTVAAINELADVFYATNEPMGIENRADSLISFDETSRIFSITPNSPSVSSFEVWNQGRKAVISTTKTVTVPNTSGLWYIYFDSNFDLQYKSGYFTWEEDTPVAYVYWNASTGKAPFVADERHGIALDWATHEYLHRTRGAVIANGFSISQVNPGGTGALDADAQINLGNGTFFDEDLEVSISHSASPVPGTFTQILQGPAQIPVFYHSGATGLWVKDPATVYPAKTSATTLQYNLFSGGSWSATPVGENKYCISWIIATNDIYNPILAILGQDEYPNVGGAEAALFSELDLSNFPITEFRPLWKVIFQTSSSYANAPNGTIASVLDIRKLETATGSGVAVSDHGLLTGLSDDDHYQYLHVTETRLGVTAQFNTTGQITTTNRIGIGTTNPTSTLHLAGIGTTTPTGDVNRIRIGDFHWDNVFTSIHAKKVRSEWWLEQNSEDNDGVDLIFYKSRGTPGAELPIQVNDNVFRLTGRAFKPNAVGIGSTITTGDWSGDSLAQISFDVDEIVDNNVYGRIDLKTQSISRLVVKSSGNVGIGTTNPTEKLHIQGTALVTGNATFQGNVYLGDNDSINIGDGNDLKIFHDGANSVIQDQGAGSLYILGSNQLVLQSSTSENYFVGNADGSVELYYNNAKKFETTLTGITVTGTVSATALSTGVAGTGININNSGTITGPATITIDPAAIGDDTGTVSIKGNLEVLGTTTTINSTTLTVVDKNIVLASGVSTLANLDTAGIDFGSTAVRLRYNYNGGTNSGLSIEGADVGIGTTSPGSKLAVNGYITENPGDGTYYNVVTQKDIGYASNQVPLNQYLGQLAFMDQYSPSGLRSVGGGSDVLFVDSFGNITISGTGRRIYGNFGGEPLSSRVFFQTNIVNTTSSLGVLPNGTSTQSNIAVFNSSDPDNSGIGIFDILGNRVRLDSTSRGTGTVPSMEVTVNGDGLRVISGGNVGIGTTNPSRKLHVVGTSLFTSSVGIGTAINIVPYDSLNNGTLAFEGSAGQLFAIKNNLTSGSIFSVNDVSGIPSIDVDANGTIELAPFGGNVGIGTTNPLQELHIYRAGGNTDIRVQGGGVASYIDIFHGADNYGIWGTSTTGRMSFATNSTERLTILSGGNVGIGTTNPEVLLHIQSAVPVIRFSESDAVADYKHWNIGANDQDFYWQATTDAGVGGGNLFRMTRLAEQIQTLEGLNNGSPWFVINNSTQNVGVGTRFPSSKLHVYGPSFPLARIERTTSVTNGMRSTFSAIHTTDADMVDGFGADISFGIRDSAGADNEIANFGAIRDGADNSGALVFSTVLNGTGQGSVKAILKSSGNFGIGTTNPGTTLEVFGTARFGGTTSVGRRVDIATDGLVTIAYGNNANSTVLNLDNVSDTASTTGHGANILWRFGTSTTTTPINAARINVIKEQQWTTTASTQDAYMSVDLATDGVLSEKVRILSSGNVGIGTINPANRLVVYDGNQVIDNPTGGVLTIRSRGATGISFPQTRIENFHNGNGGYPVVELLNSRGSFATPASVNAGDILGGFNTWGNNGSGWFAGTRIEGIAETAFSSAISAAIKFVTVSGGSETEKVRITGAGNVGIGTTNPGQKLHVEGGIYATGTVRGSNLAAETQALNLDSSKVPGLYHYDGSFTGTKPPDNSANYRVIEIGNTNRYTQIAAPWDSENLFFRRNTDGAWSTWRSILHSNSQLTTVRANSTADGGGQIYLNGATGNRIDFNTNGVAPPSFTTRSVGTKIVLYPGISPNTVDYAIGIEGNTLWNSVNGSGQQFRWYAGTTQVADLKGSGELVIGTTNLTGTASQRLQVTGGAYISGSVGIGTTNPVAPLDIRSSSVHTDGTAFLRFTATSSVNYIQSGTALTSNSAASLVFGTIFAGSEWARFSSTGNLGIGTANPVSKLAVNGYITENPGDGTYWNVVTQKDIGYASNQVPLNQYLGQLAFMDQYSPSGLRRVGGGSDDVFVNSSGFVGIGSTSPASKLHVLGDSSDTHGLLKVENTKNGGGTYFPAARFINNFANHSYGTIADFSTRGGGFDRPTILFYNSSSAHSWSVGQVSASWGNEDSFGIGYRASNNPDTFNSWPSNYFTITTSGNIGIGTTNPAWSTDIYRNVDSGANNLRLANASAGTNSYTIMNLSAGGTNGYIFINSPNRSTDGGTSTMTVRNDSGSLRLQSSGSNGIFVQGTSGNIGIGTDNPTEKLDVRGNVYVGGLDAGPNFIAFRGTTGDSPGSYNHGYVGERIWGSAERSELLIFKGNDFSQSSNGDRIRLASAEIRFDTFTGAALSGSFADVGNSANLITRMVITDTGNIGIGTTNPSRKLHVVGTSLFTSNVEIGNVIDIVPYDTLNGGTLSWEGSAGQLFSITNNLTTGSIFSVNDVSGIPSIDVDANGTVSLAPFGGTVVLKQVSETVANNFNTTLAPASNVLTVNTALGTVILGDLNASVTTWAFTNVPTTNSRAVTVTLIIDGDTAQTYGDACTVNGISISGGVKWAGGSAPTATNNFDVLTFTIVRDGAGTINVFGSGNTNFS